MLFVGTETIWKFFVVGELDKLKSTLYTFKFSHFLLYMLDEIIVHLLIKIIVVSDSTIVDYGITALMIDISQNIITL